MQVTFRQELADLRDMSRWFEARAKKRRHRWPIFFQLFAGLFFAMPLFAAVHAMRTPAFRAAWSTSGIAAVGSFLFLGIPLLTFAVFWFGAPLLRGVALRQSPALERDMTISVDRNGIRGEQNTAWEDVEAVEETAAHVFVLFGGNQVFTVPKRAFSSDFAATQFAAACRDFWTNARQNQGD